MAVDFVIVVVDDDITAVDVDALLPFLDNLTSH